MNIAQIQISRRTMYNNMCASLFDIIQEDANQVETLKLFKDAAGIHELFIEGYTMMFMGDLMERIEHFVQNDLPFIIVVTDALPGEDEFIFAVVNGEDVCY